MQGKQWNVHERDIKKYQTKVSEVMAHRLEKDEKIIFKSGVVRHAVAGEWFVTFPSGGEGIMTDQKFREVYYVD